MSGTLGIYLGIAENDISCSHPDVRERDFALWKQQTPGPNVRYSKIQTELIVGISD